MKFRSRPREISMSHTSQHITQLPTQHIHGIANDDVAAVKILAIDL